jgi:hypothetical protein
MAAEVEPGTLVTEIQAAVEAEVEPRLAVVLVAAAALPAKEITAAIQVAGWEVAAAVQAAPAVLAIRAQAVLGRCGLEMVLPMQAVVVAEEVLEVPNQQVVQAALEAVVLVVRLETHKDSHLDKPVTALMVKEEAAVAFLAAAVLDLV